MFFLNQFFQNIKLFLIKRSLTIFFFISILFYYIFAYHIERTEFNLMLFLWATLFFCYYHFIKNKTLSTSYFIRTAIIFRLVFLFSIPNLSQDFYRFIWDGRMILEGFNPYLYLPETFINNGVSVISEAKTLYEGMGNLNGSHYTNYPPLNQLCFLIAAFFASKSLLGSIIVLRVIIILADVGIIYFGKKLLEKLQLPKNNIFLYALNPFIIIEMTGNLHFEPVMLFFLVWSLYKLKQNKWFYAAILLAFSVSIKLIPFLFLPLFYKWFVNNNKNVFKKSTKLICFYLATLTTVIVLFAPFYNNKLIANYSNSIGLWFSNFEFNASFYYVFREIAYLFRGQNEIAIIGKITPIITIIFILVSTFFRQNKNQKQLITSMLFCVCFYYFMSTTIHPWYIATPLILSVFTKYRFPLIWSLIVILSYQSYSNMPWKENLLLIAIEYLIVFGVLIFELKKNLYLVTKRPLNNYICCIKNLKR